MMYRLLNSAVLLAFSSFLFGCLGDSETQYEKDVERDDAILKSYIDANAIMANQTQAGFYYTKDETNEDGEEFLENSIVGFYYEMETLGGQPIASYWEEDGAPLLFHYNLNQVTLFPQVMNLALSLAREGETFTLYSPSYLAYYDYGFDQLIPQDGNFIIRVKFVRKFTEEEVEEIEDQQIQDYIETNSLEGFEMVEKGVYVRVVEVGNLESEPSKNGNVLEISYELGQLGEEPFAEIDEEQPAAISLGSNNNLDFLNVALKDLHEGAVVEVITPSTAAFGITQQVLPFEIREDYFNFNGVPVTGRPFEPLIFKSKIINI
ncbi:peptidylprolyl isomerase [Echinicola jeungdonensis]|uniref:Peptidylprolyl isomerase n=1 Tax=Echinicola jeungdonensis TaxID=709343 RepID=A0ABV5J1L6_9BACT|nr:peptidylprolyl isomerase [Echinicola jeungdonensis]MDN3668560.1 peptidylprolyl isomerase [Echinicola jeungdonensis]